VVAAIFPLRKKKGKEASLSREKKKPVTHPPKKTKNKREQQSTLRDGGERDSRPFMFWGVGGQGRKS